MRVLILKEPKGLDDPYHLALKKFGSVHFIPVLSIQLKNIDQLEKLLLEEGSSTIIFTSGNAVKAAQSVFESSQPESVNEWTKIKCYVVGKATQKLAHELGFTCSGSNCGNAEELGKLIIKENLENPEERFLFPCGQMRRETLPTMLEEAGLKLTSITVYETTEHPEILTKVSERRKNESERPTIAVFFSPSGVNFSLPKFRAVYGEDLKDFHCAAIGRTTANALEKNGIIPCCVAERPTPEDLSKALQLFLDSKQKE